MKPPLANENELFCWDVGWGRVYFSWQTKHHDSVRESNNRKIWFVFLINAGFNYYFCRNFITKSSFSSVSVDRLRVFSRAGRNWTHSIFRLINYTQLASSNSQVSRTLSTVFQISFNSRPWLGSFWFTLILQKDILEPSGGSVGQIQQLASWKKNWNQLLLITKWRFHWLAYNLQTPS